MLSQKDLAVCGGLHGCLVMTEVLLKQLERGQQVPTACIQGLDYVLISSLDPKSVV